MKDVACEGWGSVPRRVFSFCNLDFTKVAEFSSSISARKFGAVVGTDEGSNFNMTNNEIPKAPSKSIYMEHYLVTFVNNRKMIA